MLWQWRPIARKIVGVIVSAAFVGFMTWKGLSELYRWYATGELLSTFRSRDHITVHQLVTFESEPLNFLGLFIIYSIVALLGLFVILMTGVRVRQWWLNKPTLEG